MDSDSSNNYDEVLVQDSQTNPRLQRHGSVHSLDQSPPNQSGSSSQSQAGSTQPPHRTTSLPGRLNHLSSNQPVSSSQGPAGSTASSDNTNSVPATPLEENDRYASIKRGSSAQIPASSTAMQNRPISVPDIPLMENDFYEGSNTPPPLPTCLYRQPGSTASSNPEQAPPPTYEASNRDMIHKYGGELYVEADNCLKSIQKCTFMVFTAVFLVVTFLHGSNYAGTCQSAEYGPSMNSAFYDAACSAARADIITLIMTIQFLYVFMYLFCESHRNIKSELVMVAAAKKDPGFAAKEIKSSAMNKRFTCCILSCSNELFLLITYIFVASSIVSVLTIHAKCEKPLQSIFRVHELLNPRTSGILPSYAKCTIGGMLSFSDAMNPALSAMQLKRPEQSQGVTVTVMCFAGFAITLRLATFFLIVYLYSMSLIILILMVVKLSYYANNEENLVRSAVLQEMIANED